jgi:hypothetical protein
MACRFGESTTAHRLNEFQHINDSGPRCPATTVSHRRMCMGGRTSCSVASRSCDGRPTLVKSLRHHKRAPRPWRAFTAVAFGAWRETTRLFLVRICSSASTADVAGTYRGTA